MMTHSDQTTQWNRLIDNAGGIEFRFREGFSDRATQRLINLLEKESLKDYYASLSKWFPRLITGMVTILIMLLLSLYIGQGEVNPDTLIGVEKVDESNFISYLMMERH